MKSLAAGKSNALLADDLAVDDHSMIALHQSKLDELGLMPGDTILIRGKKKKTTVAVVLDDPDMSPQKMKMSKVARSNIRYV